MVNMLGAWNRMKIRSRQINDADLDGIINLLTKGFEIRPNNYWRNALETLGSHPTPPGFPRYGYLLEDDGVPVGVILLIFSSIPGGGTATTRCNVSSWYVEPRYRAHASLLISRALKHKNVTYVNISPAMHTRPIVEAQGFARYSSGQFVSVPALSRTPHQELDVQVAAADRRTHDGCEASERELLAVHQAHGCISLWAITPERAYPFVFLPRMVKGIIPCVQLVYCRDLSDFVQFARPVGRYLAKHFKPLVIIDANGPIAGLPGVYFDDRSPKYFKGPHQPGAGDLAYTEAVMFGL
jgi:hypothetical protein